ncbi:MAG TPA: sulfite exporter TauE/SafE family protein [Chloroflexota bacterium]|nr:sulfite exporter TauE/SafE family protein [Chloroflexota bacterium]
MYHRPPGAMLEGALYLVSSFWLGAVHAATPGHGKTVSAAYLVGTRGRPTDALALGIFVTLAHTSGIIIFATIAALGSTVLSQRSESYVSLATALLMVAVGAWMLIGNWWRADPEHEHRHDLGVSHSHNESLSMAARPSWGLLFGLGLAGGLLPDPAALAVLLAALASGKLVLGLLTVLVFSLGFASVLVLVGAVVGQVGNAAYGLLTARTLHRLKVGTSIVIILVGSAMAIGAWRQVSHLQ